MLLFEASVFNSLYVFSIEQHKEKTSEEERLEHKKNDK
jgi:hypothetical protein